MTAATVNSYLDINNPSLEVVNLEVSNGETYVSKKFGTVTGALITPNEDLGKTAVVVAAFSGGTVTISSDSMSDKDLTLMLMGRK